MASDGPSEALPLIDNIVFTCPGNAKEVASFYGELLGMRIIRDD